MMRGCLDFIYLCSIKFADADCMLNTKMIGTTILSAT